jgi:hypothetical protein
MPGLVRVFEEPVVIMASWIIFIVGVLSAIHLVGAKMPTTGVAGGAGDLFRTA